MFWNKKKRVDELASIQQLEKRVDGQRLTEACEHMPIVVIDNESISKMEKSLVGCGFKMVKPLRKINAIKDVEPYQIVLIDIHGVGKHLSNGEHSLPYEGLSVAEEIKRQYPMKRVLVFSAGLSEYRDNYILRTVVDGSFDKDGNVIDRNRIITNQVELLVNPRQRWRVIRSRLLDMDIPIRKIAELEDYYVGTALSGAPDWDIKRASRILGDIKDAMAILKDAFSIVTVLSKAVQCI